MSGADEQQPRLTYYERNKEKAQQKAREYHHQHREQVLARAKEYYETTLRQRRGAKPRKPKRVPPSTPNPQPEEEQAHCAPLPEKPNDNRQIVVLQLPPRMIEWN